MLFGLLRVFWVLVMSVSVAFCHDDTGPALQISYSDSSHPPALALTWKSAVDTEDFVRISYDLRDWRLLPVRIQGDDTNATTEPDYASLPVFFQLFRQAKATLPWVTAPATTPLAEYQLLFSEAIHAPTSYHIYLPPVYRLQPLRRFPVIYWLHGSGPGTMGIPAITQYFHNAIQSRQIPPLIVVFPNSLPNGMWVDSKDGLQPVESIVIEELIPYIDRHYRTIAHRSARIAEGFSMGGYGAGRFGLKFPGLFSAVSMIGAGPAAIGFS